MIKRYSDSWITETWSLERKFTNWQKVELAVIQARESLGQIPLGTLLEIQNILERSPVDVAYIDDREKVLLHDLNSFLEERCRFLSPALQAEFHKRMTSYDTEEAPFAMCLRQSCDVVLDETGALLGEIENQAIKYRYTPMNARTHGQEAEMQSFGKRCLTWYVELRTARDALLALQSNLSFSKLSGAIGTNSGIEPELEEAALKILGFKPFVGATQIMPRILYSPIAGALADLVTVIDKIAGDIRLGARSGRPIYQEPFGKKQKGSSAMPHKKNTIVDEQNEGMARMARHYSAGIKENIKTWEERTIEQSSVERVFWPDLFHVTLRAIKNTTRVISGLVVYPDNMLVEIIESRGCYASNDAKETLLELGAPFGLEREQAYRIVQLACFNAFEPDDNMRELRGSPPDSLDQADHWLDELSQNGGRLFRDIPNVRDIISNAELHVSAELDADEGTVEKWNAILRQIFNPNTAKNRTEWRTIFLPSHILANEAHLFEKTFEV